MFWLNHLFALTIAFLFHTIETYEQSMLRLNQFIALTNDCWFYTIDINKKSMTWLNQLFAFTVNYCVFYTIDVKKQYWHRDRVELSNCIHSPNSSCHSLLLPVQICRLTLSYQSKAANNQSFLKLLWWIRIYINIFP